MFNDSNLPKYFWADAVSTACYVMNKALIRPFLKKTPYEIYKGRKSNISHFNVLGCKCFVLNNGKDNLGNFDAKFDEGIFLVYSLQSKAFRIYNKRTMTIEKFIHAAFDETNLLRPRKKIIVDLVENLENTYIHEKELETKEEENKKETPFQEESRTIDLPKEWKASKNYSFDNIIGDIY